MEGPMRRSRWLAEATAGIRFGPDREAVEAELREHIEDKLLDLRRIFPDMTEDEAMERVMDGMGDPEEIGAALAKIHRSWWGYLWKISRVLVWLTAACLLLVLWMEMPWRTDPSAWFQEKELGYSEYLDACYLSGVDPFAPGSPYEDYSNGDVERTPLRVFRPEETARVRDYELKIGQAALWSFQTRGEAEEWWLFCDLLAQGVPWQPMGWSVANHIRAVDSFGNEYYSSYEVYDLDVDRGGKGYVMANWEAPDWQGAHYALEIIDIAPGAEWLRLEYDRAGTGWSLTIPLTEGEP